MESSARLRLSILLSTLVYLLFQLAIWLVVVPRELLGRGPYVWFYLAAVLTHIGLAAALFWRRRDFRHTRTHETLSRVNLACHLTLFRLSCSPTILFLAVGASRGEIAGVALVAVVAAAFLSDLLDGQVARRLDQTTEIGAYLDSSTDYAVLIVLSVAFVILTITPLWYFLVLMFRLGGFAVAMIILTISRREVHPDTTFLGKAAVFSAMVTYAFELARYAGVRGLGSNTVVFVIEVASAAVLVVSVVDKLIYLVREVRPTR